jgi:hypothetical protein
MHSLRTSKSGRGSSYSDRTFIFGERLAPSGTSGQRPPRLDSEGMNRPSVLLIGVETTLELPEKRAHVVLS